MRAAAPLALLLAAATPVSAQSGDTNAGPRFIRPPEVTFDRDSRYFCHAFVSPGIEYCPNKTDWTMERAHDPRAPGLYRLNDATRAAIVVIPKTYKEMQAITPEQVEALLAQHVFQDGPRGTRVLQTELARTTRRTGELLGLEAVVENEDGDRFLLQLYVHLSDYSVAFSETTIALTGSETPSAVTEKQRDAHLSFAEATMVSVFDDVDAR